MESTFELENIERNMKNIYSRVSVNEMLLVIACKNGSLDIIQWIMFSDHKINTNIVLDYAFPIACENNNLEIAQFLHKHFKIESIYEEIIFSCCEDGFYDMLLWLYSKMPCSFYFIQGERLFDLFYYSIEHYKICEWLHEIYDYIPITMKNHLLFLNACKNENYEMVNLLIKMRKGGYYASFDENFNIIHYDITCELVINNIYYENNNEDCVVCYELSNVKTICNHFYCTRCLESHVTKNGFWCPYCRKEFNETQLFGHFHRNTKKLC